MDQKSDDDEKKNRIYEAKKKSLRLEVQPPQKKNATKDEKVTCAFT